MNQLTVFPKQKTTDKEKKAKDMQWAKDCIDAGLTLRYHDNYSIRQSMANKKSNYELFNGNMDDSDIERVFNYLGLKNTSLPAKTQNYPIEVPKINLLVGEEARRVYRYIVKAVGGDAITQIEEQKKEKINQALTDYLTNPEREEPTKFVKQLSRYIHVEYQDKREQMANGILKYYYRKCDCPIIFNKGFYDVLLAAEELYNVDECNGDMVVKKCDTQTLYSIRGNGSAYLEDADIIVDDGYMSLGKIIDTFYEDLTKDEIKQLEDNVSAAIQGAEIMFFSNTSEDGLTHSPKSANNTLSDGPTILYIDDGNANAYTDLYDLEGNIRVSKVKWKSFRHVKKRIYFDEKGDQQEDLVASDYEENFNEGETTKDLWISEWWEGYKIADLYIRIRPSRIQFRDMHNLSSCKSGYVGTYYNVGSSQAIAIYDRLKPYKYLYNVFMRRTELAFARNKGIIGELNLAAIPDNWTLDQWMYHAENIGWAVVDPFSEAKKGVATGKIAGNFNTFGGRTMNFDATQNIKMNIEMLGYIEQKISDVTGISRQREGAIDNRETVGGITRAVTQSSYITEHMFLMHENTKRRVLEHMLEVGKYIYRGRKDKLQYIDNITKEIIEIDGDLLNEWCYGIFVEDRPDEVRMLNSLQQLAQVAMQNDKLDFSKAIDILSNDSVSNIKFNIEEGERDKYEREAQAQESQQQSQQQIAQMGMQMETEKQDREDRRLLMELENKILLKQMEIQEKSKDLDRDGVVDNVELQKEMMRLTADYQKMKMQLDDKDKDRQLKDREITSKERIAKSKPKKAQK